MCKCLNFIFLHKLKNNINDFLCVLFKLNFKIFKFYNIFRIKKNIYIMLLPLFANCIHLLTNYKI